MTSPLFRMTHRFAFALAACALALTAACGGPDGPDAAELEQDEAAASGTYATQQTVDAKWARCVSTCRTNPPAYDPRDPLSGGTCEMYCCGTSAAYGSGRGGDVIIASRCL